eukprot:TRINITY_DN5605_c0_g1_i15.p1 TRINITY_DN5605_c0_g1~~TRINITY_DN5605_c0_g1_i15.p1  ORF type:complete len:432 (-),score=78.57 TRINITY_DN5605_c0_g1_i15:322-1617(-)
MAIFKLSKKLGQGAFGAVWKIEPIVQQDISFAVKHISINKNTDISDIEKEIALLKQCTSPYIVSYYGVYRMENLLWIIMDYCRLGSVLDMMQKIGPLPESSAVWVLSSALLGLQYLHRAQIIHRDVKAANILVTDDASVKLADFGVAEKISESIFGEVAGSPLWMAPEVCQRRPYNHKADIWSLGITGIEMIDGDPPHCALSAFRAMLVISRNPPPTLSNPNIVSKNLNLLLKLMLAKEAVKRAEISVLLKHPCIKGAKKAPFEESVRLVLTATGRSPSKKSDGMKLIPISKFFEIASQIDDLDEEDIKEKECAFNTIISNRWAPPDGESMCPDLSISSHLYNDAHYTELVRPTETTPVLIAGPRAVPTTIPNSPTNISNSNPTQTTITTTTFAASPPSFHLHRNNGKVKDHTVIDINISVLVKQSVKETN